MDWRRLAGIGWIIAVIAAAPARAAEDGFERWLVEFKAKAAEEGIRPQLLDEAFEGIAPDDEVVALDQKQPENKVTLTRYLENTVPERRVKKARRMMEEYHDVLAAISHRYGVPPKYIVALWAIESDFGRNKGNFSVVQSLATLAYEGRRAEFFSKELIAALHIMQKENMRADALVGSWAGAMGDCQFMPSTYLQFAVDGNGDGHRDIWNAPPDVFASIAHYLHALGWNKKMGWGRAVIVPQGFTPEMADIQVGKTATQWHEQGLRYGTEAENHPIPKGERVLYAMYPGSEEEGAYLVTENYKALLKWNRSRYFATAVGTLADAIGDKR